MYYPDELIEEVRVRNDIVDIISGYVKLQKKGSNHFGLCPFHNEKSPSFSVSSPKQMYYCFGCGAGGNVITFLMEYENYSFREALETLANRAGVDLPVREVTEEERRQADLKSTLLEINKVAAHYFYYQLRKEQGQTAYHYLKEKRQLSDTIIKAFGLGYSNKFSDDLYQYLRQKGYQDSILKETGLVKIEEKGTYDKFWNRVMFPIMDVNNKVIGFGGRVMGDGSPKYLNSPETKLFDKSRNLYGLNMARQSRRGYLLICEGYMDVISLHQSGYTNAVASLGTAFTPGQANLLKRYTNQVILTYDSDGAGRKAALRAIPILKDAGIAVKVLDLSPYKDPDDFMKDAGIEAFEKRIEAAKNSFLFEIQALKSDYDMGDPEQKTAFYMKVAERLLEFIEPLERNNYIEAVSKEHTIPYDDLKRYVNTIGLKLGGQGGVKSRSSSREMRREGDEGIKKSQKLLLTWLIEEESLFDSIRGKVDAEDFTEDLYQQVARMVFSQHEEGKVVPARILNHFINDEEQYKEVASLFNTKLTDSLTREEFQKAFTETVVKIKRNSLNIKSRTVTDFAELQKLVDEKAGLSRLYISFE